MALAAAAVMVSSGIPAIAQDDILPETEIIALDPTNPDDRNVGQLAYLGGIEIKRGHNSVDGISSLDWHDGELFAITDEGRWLAITPDEINGRLVDIFDMRSGNLLDERGKRLRGKKRADAEAITRSGNGEWLVSFEQDHRVWRYTDLGGPAQAFDTPLLGLTANAQDNGGLETLAATPDGLIACGEWAGTEWANCSRSSGGSTTAFDLAAPSLLDARGGAPTDADCTSDGDCFVLFRSYIPDQGNSIAVVSIGADGEAETVATLLPPLNVDNFEGLAVREHNGRTYIYIVSDNNGSDRQRILLMKFEIKNEEPAVAVAPEPVVEYETVDVVLETEMGDITIRLETERAPITAANFLRYVDEDRFDGTVFYRAMKLEREPRPNGLIQGGTQFDPKRILPGIPHEPTTETGLSHTNGALSMAMLEPGSANGDFSIMLQDQTGLDARPDAAEAIWRNGYAVFGYVIEGMEVVSAIHAAPADPNKGEGVMKGQILAKPVTIIDARRAAQANGAD